MGKRSKARVITYEELDVSDNKSKTNEKQNTKNGKGPKVNTAQIDNVKKLIEGKKVKRSKLPAEYEEQVMTCSMEKKIEKVDITKKRKQKKVKLVEVVANSVKSNKIIFVDNVPQEVPANSGTTNNAVIKQSKQFLNSDEAEVKDEDIDKFCEELTEEDNAQFDDWVKLIEAKMHSNKRKQD